VGTVIFPTTSGPKPTEFDDRYIHGELHYKGDVQQTFDRLQAFPPRYDGVQLWPVVASYDPETDRTTLYVSMTAPAEFLDRLPKAGR
jgi:hypothetical protein